MRLLLAPLCSLVLLLGAASAQLQNSFCASLTNPVPLTPSAPSTTYYGLTSLCATFQNSTYALFSLSGYVKDPTYGYYATSAACGATYLFAPPDLIELSSPSCSQTPSSKPGFCSWECNALMGTYVPFFDNIAAPKILTINPLVTQEAALQWAGLPYPLELVCNTTGCGSATGLVPNLQENVSYTVRRFRRSRDCAC
jgi:hypothetical protein